MELKEELIKKVINSEKEIEIIPSDENTLKLRFTELKDCKVFVDTIAKRLGTNCKGINFDTEINLKLSKIDGIILRDSFDKALFFVNDKRVSSTSILCKATNDCNLHCKYCYDYPMRLRVNHAKLSLDDIDNLVDMVTKYARNVTWIWHGGEPLTLGIKFYKDAQKIFEKYGWRSNIVQQMQSNGTLLNEEWVDFFKAGQIDCGISFDVFGQAVRCGSEMIQLSDKLKMASKRGLSLGTITVISAENCKRQIEAYEYLKSIDEHNAAFNYIFATDETEKNEGIIMSFQDTVDEFLKFFNYWIHDTNKPIPERTCMVELEQVTNQKTGICSHVDCRYCWLGINGNGEIYPCDRLLPDNMKVGNLADFSSIQEMYLSEGYKNFVKAVSDRMDKYCSKCDYSVYCHGGCYSNHITSPSGTGCDKQYCREFKAKFNGVYNILRDIDLQEDKENLSPIFIEKMLKNGRFTPKEIRRFLETKGYDLSSIEYDSDDLLNCSEFKLYLVFNPLTPNSSYRIDSIDIFLQNRDKILEDLFNKYEDSILLLGVKYNG